MDRLQSIRNSAESKRDSLGEVSCERVLRFVRDYRDVFTQQEMDEKPATWEERAWPILRRCMTETRSRYFLSIDELLLVCNCSQQNAAIFSANGVDLIHQASCIHDEHKEMVCVVLQEGPGQQRSTRSHFQRLISEDDVAKLEEKRAKDAAETKDRKKAEEMRRNKEAEEKHRLEAEERIRKLREEKRRLEAEEQARKHEEEEKAKKAAREQAKKREEEEKAKKAAEEQAKLRNPLRQYGIQVREGAPEADSDCEQKRGAKRELGCKGAAASGDQVDVKNVFHRHLLDLFGAHKLPPHLSVDVAATADQAVIKEKIVWWVKNLIGGNPLPHTSDDYEHVLLDPDVVDKIRMSVPSVKTAQQGCG